MKDELKIKSVNNLSLPIKYVIGLVIIILLLLVGGYAYYNQLINSLEENYKSSIKISAKSTNSKIDKWYNDWVDKLNTITEDSSITHFVSLKSYTPSYRILQNNIETQLRHYLDDNDFGALEIIDLNGKVVYSAGIKLDEKSIKVYTVISNHKDIPAFDSTYFLIAQNNEIRFVVSIPILLLNNKIGYIYTEINTDAAFGSYLNNLLVNNRSDIDISYIDGISIISLRSKIYNNFHYRDADKPDQIQQVPDHVFLNTHEGLINFNDEKAHTQYAYVVTNQNTGWVIVARDKNKEKYSYLIEDLSDYILYGIAFLLIASVLLMILWKKILELYTSAVKSNYAIADLQSRFNHFSKFSQDIFFLLDKNGKIVDYNEKAFNTYGYTGDELKEMNIRELRIIKDRNKTDNYFKSSEKLKGLVFDSVHRKKDKTQFEVEVSMKEVALNGKAFIQNIIRDVSVKKSVEKKLKESEEVFELIVNNLNEVVYIFSIKPLKKFTYISSSIERLTGYKLSDFILDPSILFKIVHPDDRYKIKLLLEGKIGENSPPVKFIKKDGTIIWVLHRNIPKKNEKNELVSLIGIFRDVTEQLQSEIQLKNREESFRNLFENNPLPMWLYNFNTKHFIDVNESAIQHYGYSKEEFFTLKLTDIIIEDTSVSIDENEWLTSIKAGKTNEYIHTVKNGNIISVEVNAHIVHLNDSEDNLILEVVQDITERKRVESKIEESEQRFKTLAKISPVAIFRTNSRGELTYMNENWTEMTGIFPEIAFGRKWWEGLPIQDRNLIEKRWKRSVQVSNSFESEFELLNPKSKVKWVLASIVKISSADEKIMGYVGTLTDITRMKMFEGNFRKLYYSVEQSPVSIVITDTKGNIEFVNPAVLKTTGYSKDELMGNNPNVLKSGYQDKIFYKKLWDTISSGKIWQGELNNKRKDGTYYWEHASISPVFNERKEITNYVAVKEDITAKKSLYEELVKAKNDALESSRIKTNFLTKINHELRTPLVGIIGCSHSVFDEAENSRVKELGKILIDESARLNNSLKSILSLSSLETEEQNPNLEVVDVSAIVKSLHKQFSKSAAIKNIDFTTNDFVDNIYVNANKEMLSEIISNLIDNAIKFTERGSIIIYSEFADDECIVSIKDTGIGIPDNSKQIIFEPFRQAEGLTKQSGGIGLGLTLAKKYTDVMGGKLWFESEVNNGTTFHLSLNLVMESEKPILVLEPAIIPPVAEYRISSTKKKLLIVEDDEINLRITQMYLRSLFDISVAENSTIALENVATNKFDIILMDIGLKHGLNGMELTRILRKMSECATIPIIAITAFTLAKDKEDIMNAGCSHYLAKPFVKEELLDVVKKALS